MSLSTFRNQGYNLLPTWARNWNLYRLLYAIFLICDELGDILLASIKIRFQGLYSNESMGRIGSERQLWQGPNETPESFALRLGTWWDVAKHSGTFLCIAQQMQAYCLPATYKIEIVSNNGTRYTLGADGSWTIDTVSWDWDGDASQWSRFWILIANQDPELLPLPLGEQLVSVSGTDQPVLNAAATVGQWTGAPGSRDVGADTPFLNYDTSQVPDHRELRRIMEVRRDPHTFCMGILLLKDYAGFWDNPPDGTWNYWANRNRNALYWSGTHV